MYFCVLKYKMTLTVACHVPFFAKSNFHTVLICTVHTVFRYKTAHYCHIFNSICISTEGVFFMCEGYTELAPLVAIFYTSMVVEKKCRRLWINTSSCSRLAVNALSFFNLNFILFFVVLWTCQVVFVWTLQTVFVMSVASLWFKKINGTWRASLEKCTRPILVWSWEIKISHGLHTRYVMFV
jgi:hypothetical protein